MPETYNGWASYPTWVVAMWLNNDQGSQEMLYDIIREAGNAYDAAESLERVITEDYHPFHGELADSNREPDMYSDLLGWALNHVDWRDIIDAEAAEMDDAYGADPDEDDD